MIYIGAGSLDLANHRVDPVPTTPINERQSRDRVADAIARLAAHEIGHALGLVPRATELSGDGLASKLMVTGLGLNGTATHHNPVSNDICVMKAVANLSVDRTWNIGLYDFEGKEKPISKGYCQETIKKSYYLFLILPGPNSLSCRMAAGTSPRRWP